MRGISPRQPLAFSVRHLTNVRSYPAAITDARASLNYKKALHPPESEVLAEAHFKLSLALEYASVTTTEEEAGAAGVKGESVVDQEQRDEACKELQAAIDSTKLKMGIKEKELEATPEDESEGLKGEISNLKDIIGDMEDRVCLDPPVTVTLSCTSCPSHRPPDFLPTSAVSNSGS